MLRALLRSLLAEAGAAPRLAVLAPPDAPDLLGRRVRRRAAVVTCDLTASPASRQAALAAGGRYDVIVLDARGREWPSALAELLFHLRPGGALVFRGREGRRTEPLLRRLQVLDEVREGRREPAEPGRKGTDVRALAAAIDSWRVADEHIVVRAGGVTAYAKLREEQVDPLLEPGSAHGRVLARVPAERFTARCTIEQSASAVRRVEVGEIEAPAMALRAYDDVVCLPRQVVVQGGALLPDSFRRMHRRRLFSTALTDLAPGFAAVRWDPKQVDDAEPLPGAYVHLDSEFPGHYGHLVTEQLSRLWAWPSIRAEVGRPRVLLSTRTERARLHVFERELLAAFGVAEDDVVLIDRPVRVERLLAASPMMAQPRFVHPAVERVWCQLGDTLAAQAPDRERPRRIFCGRTTGKRACRNAAEVEALFVEEGFTVVHPEEHSLAEQAALFRDADVIAGYAGAAMFNLCHTHEPKHVVLLVSESYTAENELLMAAVQGHRLSVLWCPSDVPLPETGFSAAAYQSSFVADLAKDGAWLRSQLRG